MLPSLARFTRLFTATVAVLAVFAAVAGSAHAGPVDCGNKLCLDLSPEPDVNSTNPPASIIPNGNLIYRVDITNPAGITSTATKVTLTLNLDDNVVYSQYLGASRAGQPTQENCTQPPAQGEPRVDVITCDLGSVKPSDTPVTLRFFVVMPSSDPSTTTSVATLTSDARDNDHSNGGSDPTDESLTDSEEVSVGLDQGTSASAVNKGDPVTLNTDPFGTGANSQHVRTALFTILANDFFTSAVVDDNVADPDFVCPPGLFCPTGGWVQAVIPGPAFNPFGAFTGKNSINLVIRENSTLLPKGLTTSNYVLIHDTDYDPTTTDYQLISRNCKKNPAPCLNQVQKLPDGDFLINAQVTGNWRYR